MHPSSHEHDEVKLIPLIFSAFGLLTSSERKQIWLIGLFLAVVGIFDLISLATIMPVVALILQPDSLLENQVFLALQNILPKIDIDEIVVLATLLASVMLVSATALNTLALWVVQKFGAQIQVRLGRELTQLLFTAPYSWFIKQNNASLVRFLHSDITRWGRDFIQRIISLAQNSVSIILPFGLVLSVAPLVGLMSLIVILMLSLLIYRVIMPKVKRAGQTSKKATDELVTIADHAINGIKDIKVACQENTFSSEFVSSYHKYSQASVQLNVWQIAPSSVVLLLGQLTLLAIAIILTSQNVPHEVIAGQLALIILVTSRVIPATNRFLGLYTSLWNSIPWVKLVIALHAELTALQGLKNKGGAADVVDNWSKISFKNVSFSYSKTHKKSLTDVSLTFERCKSYGLVGISGSGKSTLIDVLIGLHLPDAGKILVDDKELQSYCQKSWRKTIGYVPQKPYFLDTTIRSNIALGVEQHGIDEERMQSCLNMSNAAEFVDSLADGIDTRIGDRGISFSGGQLQRLAIARALYQDPKILILDEASANLDSISQREFQCCIDKLSEKLTTISIAHRLETLRNCDEIIQLEKGRIIARGDFEKLKKTSKGFQKLLG